MLVDLLDTAAAAKAAAEEEKSAPLPECIPEESTLGLVPLLAVRRAYAAVAASRGGIDGMEAPRSGREVCVAFTQVLQNWQSWHSWV